MSEDNGARNSSESMRGKMDADKESVAAASMSPTLSVGAGTTKSIMNVGGKSGAVVSNTPEPGLKRIPTVTFSDSKIVGLNKFGASDERKPGALGGAESALDSKELESQGMVNLPQILHDKLVDRRTPSNGLPDIQVPLPEKEEHPHFLVEDPLHSPKVRSRANSLSPSTPQVDLNGVPLSTAIVNGNDAKPGIKPIASNPLERDGSVSLSKGSEQPLLESVIEEASSTPGMANIPKRENAKNLDMRLPQDDGKIHILFGATGSMAVFKIKPMVKKLVDIYGKDRISIQVVLTKSAEKFLNKKVVKKVKPHPESNEDPLDVVTNIPGGTINECAKLKNGGADAQGSQQSNGSTNSTPDKTAIGNNPFQLEGGPVIQIWRDQDEWDVWKQRSDPVLHIELRRWADILVVAPLTANTLSKIALGLCDNLLTCVIRAWNPNFPIFLAPSMVSSTFNSVMTKKQLAIIKEEMPWITVFKPSEKVMGINGDIGLGGMMDPNEIVDKVVMKLGGYPKEEDEDEDDEDEDEDEDEENETCQEGENKKDEDEDEDEDDDDDDDDDEDEDEDEEDENNGGAEETLQPVENSQ